ncbi:MAG: UDPglucose--hexose-1-phosphate uridylyltransferase [Parcubacteria group bacterium Gr01-1014_44]|nr:MAG: UDPglucose--hexose-1-phosphate uridylyltransferase [Parcubacteria group bacterium Gr01-1014_44]
MSDLNEFRQDLVSGDWVLFAAGRAKRPNATEKSPAESESENTVPCPFDDPRASGQEIVSEYKKSNGELWVTAIKNKYPAVAPGLCAPIVANGPFSWTPANGFHEVLVTTDHQRTFSDFTVEETTIILKAYRDRYLDIAKYECGDYIQIFHNYGKLAGASVPHPHSQILSTPILPPVVSRSINGSAVFFKKNEKRVHQVILEWEMEQKKRVVFENDFFIAFCPFTSKRPYEVRIFPKVPNARFETADDKSLESCAETLNFCLGQLKKVFNGDLSFNFFIHTSPVRESAELPCSEFYHWHIEIVPHYSNLAGFDFSTGIILNVVDPDEAAEQLRNA